jgi:hypothetical protein
MISGEESFCTKWWNSLAIVRKQRGTRHVNVWNHLNILQPEQQRYMLEVTQLVIQKKSLQTKEIKEKNRK